jgi:hypothetical protein
VRRRHDARARSPSLSGVWLHRAVLRRGSAVSAKHPARYSPAILDTLCQELEGAPWVHDPFAGTGERLQALTDTLGIPFTGTEIEAPFIVSPHVEQGDSRDPSTYPPAWKTPRWWIVTSPVYPSGMCDHFISSGVCSACRGTGHTWVRYFGEDWETCPKCNGTGRRQIKRHTYRQAAIELSGEPSYALDRANMGRYSPRGGRKAEETYWALASEVAAQWTHAERVILNTKDVIVKGDVYHVTLQWTMLLRDLGWKLDHAIKVPCPGQRHGANRDARVDHEDVTVFV